ncbi:hypothetical protein [Alkalibacillus salilacus]|uniref:Uncharacterized protein n=1 Tax=Alkalibacillus salilacus TaxID=284582 RepID=A0ABT9VDE1_9BACI|nr:hypothetical protein [Alkalibacillus salilacus]MDQ0158969.1 hypothetical protein [Alkalibacillus salilacus]
MSGFIAKQPNGLYCRFSTAVDCPTHINMTKEDYLNNVTGTVSSREEGGEVLKNYLFPFEEIVERFVPNNMTESAFEEVIQKVNDSEQTEYEVI